MVAYQVGDDRRRLEPVVLPVEVHHVGRQPQPEDLERLVEPALRLVARHPVESGLDRGDAPADAEHQPAAGQLVEGGGLLDHPHRVDQRQDRDQRPQPDRRGALGRGRQHQVRGGDAERGAVMLGQLVGVEAEPLVRLDQRQALGQLGGGRPAG
jgi:hypothetical protein